MEMIYQYLTGPRFRQRVQAIVEPFHPCRRISIGKESNNQAMGQARGANRAVMQATVGMYGDLQGIAGKTFRKSRDWNYVPLRPHLWRRNNPATEGQTPGGIES